MIIILLFFNQEIFGSDPQYIYNKRCKNNESFVNSHIPPFETDEYTLDNPDMDYYFDKTGRKATMYRELGNLAKEESVLNKVPKKIDNFNSIINKLEIYDEDIYNQCNLHIENCII